MRTLSITTLIAFIFSVAAVSAQQEVNPVEAKLRESLRSTMLELRKVQTEKATVDAELQALKISSEKEIKGLNTKFEELAKRSAEEKTLADATIAEQKKSLEVADLQGTAVANSLDKWKAAHMKVTAALKKSEAEREAAKFKALETERVVADRERKNLELFRIANEVLERYENFALGRALLAREPFTGISKVKIEEQVQDYKDKLTDQFVKTGDPIGSPAAQLQETVQPEQSGQTQPAAAPATPDPHYKKTP